MLFRSKSRAASSTNAAKPKSPATPRINWTEPGDKDYDATLAFTVTQETPATLVVMQDMPGDGEEPKQTRIEVVLLPRP